MRAAAFWDVVGTHTYTSANVWPVVVTITETANDGSSTPYVVDSTVTVQNAPSVDTTLYNATSNQAISGSQARARRSTTRPRSTASSRA